MNGAGAGENRRSAGRTETGALRKDVADERSVRVGAGSAHAATDTAPLVPHHGAERLRHVVPLQE